MRLKPTDYDQVPYPSALFAQTHPDRLAVMATLFGLKPARVEGCHMLELGCGDGSNLIAMASALPEGQFLGIDLAARPIQKGTAVIQALGLKNVTLRQLDILESPAEWGPFDFILAHGLYSWVPPQVRDKILAVCAASLAEQGVAYVSYNAYPGNHTRDLVRQVMQYHARHFPEPHQQIRQARALIKFLAELKAEPDVYGLVLKRELERILKYDDAGFFHDDLNPANHPVYFHEFITHASGHGLQYLAEADMGDMREDSLAPQAVALLSELGKENIIAREQYLDFIKGRAFRQTLLCRQEIPLQRELKPERTRDLFIASAAKPVSANPDASGAVMEDFSDPTGSVIATANPLIRAAIRYLGQVWPRSVQFKELLLAARASLIDLAGAGKAVGETVRGSGLIRSEATDAPDLGEFLLKTYPLCFVELYAHPDSFVTEVSERPVASPLARLQLREGNVVATLRHTTLRIEDKLGHHLLRLLDGTRDRPALLKELNALVQSGAAAVLRQGQPITDLDEAGRILGDELENNLTGLARAAVLIA